MKHRKIAIIGSRTFSDYNFMQIKVDSLLFENEIPTIISGGAVGADAAAVRYARSRGFPYVEFPARWREHGRSAGFIRNRHIIDAADYVLAFWDGVSRGTKHSIDLAKMLKKNLAVFNMRDTRRVPDETLLRRSNLF